jgi:hypothetical protein
MYTGDCLQLQKKLAQRSAQQQISAEQTISL